VRVALDIEIDPEWDVGLRAASGGDPITNNQDFDALHHKSEIYLDRAFIKHRPQAVKGCELLAAILPELISDYRQDGIQVAAVADGTYQSNLQEVAQWHNLHGQVAVRRFDERISHLGYAASDFVLMPSRFEPCGLCQMVGAKYGSLPVVHDTGGLHDTVSHLDVQGNTGNGFVFETYDGTGFRWAIDQAMQFHNLPPEQKQTTITRVMTEAADRFNHAVTAEKYFELYENMLERPLVR